MLLLVCLVQNWVPAGLSAAAAAPGAGAEGSGLRDLPMSEGSC